MKNFTLLLITLLSLKVCHAQNMPLVLHNISAHEHNAAAQSRSLIPLLDSVQTWDLDSINLTSWDLAYREVNITYNADNEITYNLYQAPWGGWHNYEQENFIFGRTNLLATYSDQYWLNNNWDSIFLDTFAYNSNNLIIDSFQQYYNNNVAATYSQNTWTYNGNLESGFVSQYGAGNSLTNQYLDTFFTYNANNQVTGYTEQNWFSNAWSNFGKYFNYYNSNNQLSGNIEQAWENNTWVNNDSNSYNYNSTNLLSTVLEYVWINDSLTKAVKVNYTYDANNNISSIKYYRYTTNYWAPDLGFSYTYDANNILLSVVNKIYDGIGDSTPSYGSDSAYYYFNRTASGVNQLSINNSQLSVYPNPSSGIIYTDIKLQQPSNLQLRLVNMLGQTVWVTDAGTVSSYQNNISVADLADGVYLLEMVTGDGTEVREVVVQK